MKWMELDKRLAETRLRIFTDRDFRRIAGVSKTAASFQLMRYTKRGYLCRLKRGLYASRGRMPSRWAVANKVYAPSYISLSSALSYYGILPESVYSVTSITTRTTREFKVDEVAYSYRTMKREVFTGYRAAEIDGETVLIAEKEKAVADYLYFVFLKKEAMNRRLDLSKADRRKVKEFLRLYKNPRLIQWYERDLPKSDRRTAY